MSNLHLACFGEDCRFHFLFCTKDNIGLRQNRACVRTEGTRVMPLVSTKVQVKEYGGPCGSRALHREKCCAFAWFAAKVRSGKLKGATLLKRSSQYIINCQLHVSSIIPIKDQGKPVRWFDTQDHRATAGTRLAWDKARVNPFRIKEVQNEISNRVYANSSQKSGFQIQPL
jgi:hypothetical protein